MLVDDYKCLCDKCMKSSRCDTQRAAVNVQRVVADMKWEAVTLTIVVSGCKMFVSKMANE